MVVSSKTTDPGPWWGGPGIVAVNGRTSQVYKATGGDQVAIYQDSAGRNAVATAVGSIPFVEGR